MMDLVLHHGAQPFPGGEGRAFGSHALAAEILGRQAGKDVHRLAMQPFGKTHHLLVSIGEFLAAAGIAARAPGDRFGEHVAVDGSDVAHEVAQRELAGAVGSFYLVGRNAAGDAHGAAVNFVEVVEEGGEISNLQFRGSLNRLRGHTRFAQKRLVIFNPNPFTICIFSVSLYLA
jgi:hypothetical protein